MILIKCNGNLLPYAFSPQHSCLAVLVTSLDSFSLLASLSMILVEVIMCIMMQLDIKWTSEEECYILNK